MDPLAIGPWCITRFEKWASSVGLETFRDEDGKPGRTVLVFGGKVVVLDIECTTGPHFELEHVNVSYAFNNESGSGSPKLCAHLLQSFRRFVHEVQKPQDQLNPVQAAQMGRKVLGQLKFLVLLDKLASSPPESGGGIRWFTETDELGSGLNKFAVSEALEVAKYVCPSFMF